MVPALISDRTWSHPPDFVILLPDIIISLENNTQFMNRIFFQDKCPPLILYKTLHIISN